MVQWGFFMWEQRPIKGFYHPCRRRPSKSQKNPTKEPKIETAVNNYVSKDAVRGHSTVLKAVPTAVLKAMPVTTSVKDKNLNKCNKRQCQKPIKTTTRQPAATNQQSKYNFFFLCWCARQVNRSRLKLHTRTKRVKIPTKQQRSWPRSPN